MRKNALLALPLPLSPVVEPDFSTPQYRIVDLVDRMLTLHKQLVEVKISQEKTIIQRQIDATDRHINQLVYQLCGLTEEEVRIVEESTV